MAGLWIISGVVDFRVVVIGALLVWTDRLIFYRLKGDRLIGGRKGKVYGIS